MKLCSAKVWIYLIGFDMGDLTNWMRHSWMPLVYKLKHDFENLDFWGIWFLFFFKMDEAWPNTLSLEMVHDFWKSWFFFFFFFLERWWWWSSFLKMNEAWPYAPSLQIDAWLMKTLIFEEKMISSFFKMDEAWPNALSLEMDAWFLEILIFFFFLKWWWWWSFFENEWGMAECP